MNKKVSMLTKLTLTPLLISGVGFTVVDSVYKIPEEKTAESPYRNVVAQNSMGSSWLDSFLGTQPFSHSLGGDITQWSKTTATRTLIPSDETNCVSPQPMPPYILDVQGAKNNLIEVNAAITQPGLSKDIINRYEERAADCNVKFKRVSEDEVELGNDTTLLFYGDTIVSLSFDKVKNMSKTDKDQIVEETRQAIMRTLEQSQCLSISTSVNDKYRNIYYTVDNEPVGLFKDEEVLTTVDLENLPTLSTVEEKLVNYPNLTKPEAPYPVDFPDVPAKQEMPEILELPQMTNDVYAKNINYEIVDENGAGCGWSWAINQESPVYDKEKLTNEANTLRNDALKEVNVKASEFVNNYMDSFSVVLNQQVDIVKWNNYVDNVNSVHNRWNELTEARKSIKTSYLNYVNSYNSWLTFDERKNMALETFKKMNDECIRREEEHAQWLEKKKENSANRVNNANSADKEPIVCSFGVPRPSILDTDKPAEPTFNIPEGVTIPNSWTKVGQQEDKDTITKNEKNTLDSSYTSFLARLSQLEKDQDNKIKEEERKKVEEEENRKKEEEEKKANENTNPIDDLLNSLNL